MTKMTIMTVNNNCQCYEPDCDICYEYEEVSQYDCDDFSDDDSDTLNHNNYSVYDTNNEWVVTDDKNSNNAVFSHIKPIQLAPLHCKCKACGGFKGQDMDCSQRYVTIGQMKKYFEKKNQEKQELRNQETEKIIDSIKEMEGKLILKCLGL